MPQTQLLNNSVSILTDDEVRNQAILDALIAHIVVLDSQGNIVAVNRAWKKFAKSNGDPELKHTGIGQNYLDVCRKATGNSIDQAEETKIGLMGVLDGSLPHFSLEYPCHSPTEKRWFLLSATPLNANLDGAVLSHTNITQRVLLDKEWAEELARSNADLEQFAYVASHDLREPLRMISSYVNLLAKRYRGQLDEDADEFINFAVDGAIRMQQLINDLLIYSRAGERDTPLSQTDCDAVMDEVLTLLEVSISEHQAEISYSPLPTLMANPQQLTQLFQNLISNALKFRAEARPAIHISVESHADCYQFSVKDNGIGMSPQYTERIFQLFKRLGARTEYPGTGIGLAICQRIVQRHGGKIWAESALGQGTTFFFTIRRNTYDNHEQYSH